MTRIIIIILTVHFIACNSGDHTLIGEEDLINRIVEEEMPQPSTIKLLTEDRTEISLDSLKILERTGNYFEDFYVNKNSEIVQLIIRPKTQEDEQLLNKITWH